MRKCFTAYKEGDGRVCVGREAVRLCRGSHLHHRLGFPWGRPCDWTAHRGIGVSFFNTHLVTGCDGAWVLVSGGRVACEWVSHMSHHDSSTGTAKPAA